MLNASFDPVLTSSWQAWVSQTRAELNLPVSVRWRDASDEWLPLGDESRATVRLDVKGVAGLCALLEPSLDSLGSAYVNEHLDVEGPIKLMLSSAQQLTHRYKVQAQHNQQAQTLWDSLNKQGDEMFSGKTTVLQRLLHNLGDKRHDRDEAERSVRYHYDVSNPFFEKWLGPDMVYSCAYFEDGRETLAQAQLKKIDHVLNKLRLQDGQSLLDIGCGWGALLLRAAQRFKVRCVGITLSQNQLEWATERVEQAGLSDRVEVRLQDYRDVTETFDRISSVGMFEHVGIKQMERYFRTVHDLLKPGGWALNHGITSTDAINRVGKQDAGQFIEQFVFPNGELPHIGEVLTSMQLGGLDAVDVEGMRRHYERTFSLWSEAFESQSSELRGLVSERVWRTCRVYLAGCAWAFENDAISIYQVLCHRSGASAQTLPWTRQWMYP